MSFVRQHSIALIALGVAIGAFAFAAYAFNPVKVAENEVVEPAAARIGLGLCPAGWENESAGADHVQVKVCTRDGWQVVLDENDKFERARQDLVEGDWITDPKLVPGWPQ